MLMMIRIVNISLYLNTLLYISLSHSLIDKRDIHLIINLLLFNLIYGDLM